MLTVIPKNKITRGKITDSMMPFSEVAVMDKNSEYRGVPPMELMENAGKALADVLMERYPDSRFLFICGTGNNGGDAYVAARYLSDKDVLVYLLKGKEAIRSEIAWQNFGRLECDITDELDWEGLEGFVIVDGMLGTGVQGSIREPYRSVIQKINKMDAPVVSIDVPSGLGADLAVEPELTVTFHEVKEGMERDNCGEIIVKSIGVPDEAVLHTGPGEVLLYPRPTETSYKGQNGRLLVIGGGPYTGAPALVAKAAYRTGVDLVHVAVPSRISSVVAGYDPHHIVHPLKGDKVLPGHVDKLVKIMEHCDAAVIGPGLGRDDATLETVSRLLELITIPKVIDADALMAVPEADIAGDAVLTPHRGEFRVISGIDDFKEEDVDEFAAEHRLTILLKRDVDYMTDGERYKLNDFGSPTMTVGGTGDTLAGVVGALLSKGMTSFDAARVGAYVTCRAGELAFEEFGWGTLPGDIQEFIPKVIG